MFEFDEEELRRIADAHAADIDDNFRLQLTELSDELSQGDWPVQIRYRTARVDGRGPLAVAIAHELRALLCTNDRRWSSVRTQSKDFSKVALPTLAGYIAGAYHVTVGLATAGVALVVLAIAKMGVNVFCTLSTPSESDQ